MSSTLTPVLKALGFHGDARQRDVVKLLQASGAFGELPNVTGVLSDRQAQAVLAAVTFPTAERAAEWLHDVTQAHMLRPHGTERYQHQDKPLYAQHRAELLGAIKNTGMLDEIAPTRKQYDHVLVLGAMEGGVNNRLDTLGRLWDQGVRFNQVHLLGSERALVPEHEFIATLPGAGGKTLSTEMQMMQALYYDKSTGWPEGLRKLPVFAVNTPNHADGSRANTHDIMKTWVDANPETGSILVISSQPHLYHQDAVAKAVLPSSFSVETVGASVGEVKINVAMDSLARQIDAGFPQLLETLKSQKTPPPPQLALFDPARIQVDAATYQFRSGGDSKGVTQKGRYHADHWDAILHGEPLLVHEKRDGSLFVADGHHRLDLAKKLNAAGNGPGMIAAQVLREADGYTAQDVKIIAAYKNIAHGQTDPVDTARVFKEAQTIDHPQWLPSLQMDKGNLRMSYSLSRLPDAALDYIARGEVPADKGAMVAERVSDPNEQETVMRMVSEKLKLRYQPGTQSYHARFSMGTWPPAFTLSSQPEPLAVMAAAEKEFEGQWVKMLNRQRAVMQSIVLH